MIRSLNQVFQKIYLIGDYTQSERKQLIKLDISYDKVGDVTIKDPSDKESHTSYLCNVVCDNTEVGKCLTHKKAWKHMIDHNIKHSLIMQPNVKFHDDFYNKLNGMWPQVPHDWDILYFPRNSVSMFHTPPPSGNNKRIIIPHENERIPLEIYAINLNAAKKLMQNTAKIKTGYSLNMIDIATRNCNLKKYGINGLIEPVTRIIKDETVYDYTRGNTRIFILLLLMIILYVMYVNY